MSRWVLAAILAFFPGSLLAVPVSIDFFGVQLTVVGEFINAVPVPDAEVEFAPLFGAGQTLMGSIAFDTAQPDFDPDPNVGTYRTGTLSVQVPELGLLAIRSSSSMQISSFNDTSNPDDQFFAFVNGVDIFANAAGIPSPVSFSVLLFGDLTMLSSDALPTGALDWTFGNLSFDITGSDGRVRQVLMSFSPAAVPEPTTTLLLAISLAAGLCPFRKRA